MPVRAFSGRTSEHALPSFMAACLLFLSGCYKLDFNAESVVQDAGMEADRSDIPRQLLEDADTPPDRPSDSFTGGSSGADGMSDQTGLRGDSAMGEVREGADARLALDTDIVLDAGLTGPGSLVDTPCDVPGGFGCDGTMSKLQLLCDSRSLTWRIASKCPGAAVCDRSSGDCLPVLPQCEGKKPGDRVCIDRAIRACGPDLVTAPVVDTCENLSGECARCKPQVVATGKIGQFSIVLAGGYVYWSSNASEGILRTPKKGGPVEPVASGAQWGALSMVTDGDYAYWFNVPAGNNGVYRASVGGGVPTRVTTEPEEAGTVGTPNIALDDDYVYWPSNSSPLVRRAPKAGGKAETFLTLASGGGACCLQADSKEVFWLTGETTMRASNDGTGIRELMGVPALPNGLALDGEYIYWSNRDSGDVLRVSRAGGEPATLATDQQVQNPVVVDSASIYWTNKAGMLVRAPITGGLPSAIQVGLASSGSLTSDRTSLCWHGSSAGQGAILCIEK